MTSPTRGGLANLNNDEFGSPVHPQAVTRRPIYLVVGKLFDPGRSVRRMGSGERLRSSLGQ